MKRFISVLLILTMLVVNYSAALADRLELPVMLEVVEDSAFYGSTAITEVEIPYGTERIENLAFAYSGVTLADIPDSVTYIADNAFEGTNVTIRCDADSYASQWAERNGVTWTDGTSPDDLDDTLQQLADSEMTADDLHSEQIALISTAGITDEEMLASITEFNGLIEQANQLAQENNTLADALLEKAAGLAESFQGLSTAETADYIKISIGKFSMQVDKHISNASAQGVTIGTVTPAEDGRYFMLSASNGETWYMYETDNHSYFTTKKPTLAANAYSDVRSNARSRGFREDFLTAIQNTQTQIQLGINAVSQTASYFQGKAEASYKELKSLVAEGRKLISGFKRIAIDYYRLAEKHPWNSEEYLARARENEALAKEITEKTNGFAKELDQVSRRLTWLKRLCRGIAGINLAFIGLDLNRLIQYGWEIIGIQLHGHPTDSDIAGAVTDVAEKMNREIGEMWLYLSGRFYVALTEVGLTVAALVGAIPSDGVSVVLLFVVEEVIAMVNRMADNRINEMMTTIRENHNRLHTIVHGVVRDFNTSEPLANVNVSDGVTATLTDSTGGFELYVEPGEVELKFKRVGYEEYAQSMTVVNGERQTFPDVYLKPVSGLLYGYVYNAVNGMPLYGAEVFVSGQNDIYYTTTDADGRYELPVPGERCEIVYQASGYDVDYANVKVPVGDNKLLIIYINPTFYGDYFAYETEKGIVTGYVKDAVTGAPLAGVGLRAGNTVGTYTDSSGYFELWLLPRGSGIRVWCEGYEDVRLHLHPSGGYTTQPYGTITMTPITD